MLCSLTLVILPDITSYAQVVLALEKQEMMEEEEQKEQEEQGEEQEEE